MNETSNAKKDRFEKEVLVHLDSLFGLALSLTRNRAQAEDLVQDAVLKAYKAYGSFEPGTNLKAWLFKILKNTWISQWRKTKHIVEISGEEDHSGFSLLENIQIAAGAHEGADTTELLTPENLERIFGDEVKSAIDALPEEFREIIYLCDVQELTYQEIADILNIPIGTVRSRLSRARGTLQKVLWEYARDRGLWRRSA